MSALLSPDHNVSCEAFVRCDRPATGAFLHPILEAVLSCQRCADRLEQDLLSVQVDGSTLTLVQP